MQKIERPSNQMSSYSILHAPDDVHARQRKMLSHAFSDRAVYLLCVSAEYQTRLILW
jgi:cytochrome P450